jgi:glycosyltransferase involved in cell wall biosynthesis
LPASVSEHSASKPTLAIISTFDDLCGIAAYTRYLVKQLEPHFHVTVLDLDQYLLRHTSPHVRKLGDRLIRDMCAKLQDFDCVNIQLEHGTLGLHARDIYRRLRWIVQASPRLSISSHTIMSADGFDFGMFLSRIFTLKWGAAYSQLEDEVHSRRLGRPLYRFYRRQQQVRPIHFIVHTGRDFRFMRYVNRLENVHHHPLSFLSEADASTVRTQSNRSAFPSLDALPADAHIIGVFGFFGPYKGFDTVVKALGRLPKNYHLAIFGGVHPNDIKRNQKLHPYIRTILDSARADFSLLQLEEGGEIPHEPAAKPVPLTMQVSDPAQMFSHPKDVSDRVHFMGSLTDEQFFTAMSVSDSVVLPYLEVGQSSSGPMSQAVELGCRVFAARNQAFMQFAKYHPDALTFFDVGNYIELAEKIMTQDPKRADAAPSLKFNTFTNAEVYRLSNSPT